MVVDKMVVDKLMMDLPEKFTYEQALAVVNIYTEPPVDYRQMERDRGTLPIKISEERFMYFLEVLPPRKWICTKYQESFYVMECSTADLHLWCVRIGKNHYSFEASYEANHEQVTTYVREAINLAYRLLAPKEMVQRYDIYAANAADLGWTVKSFLEWSEA